MIKVCLRIFSIWFKLFLLSLTFFTQSHALLARISIFVSARDKLRAQDNQKMTRNWKKVENLKFRDTFLSIFALKILFCFSFQCFFYHFHKFLGFIFLPQVNMKFNILPLTNSTRLFLLFPHTHLSQTQLMLGIELSKS